MRNTQKTKSQLLEEISVLRSRKAELEEGAGNSQIARRAVERLERTGMVNEEKSTTAPVQGNEYRPSDKTRVEEAIKETEAQCRVALEEGTVPRAILNPDLQLVKVNRAFCDLLGYTKHDLEGLTIRDITHPDDVEQSVDLTTQVFKSGLPSFQLENRYSTKSQTIIWCSVAATVVRDREGKPTLIVVTIENITDRKGAENELKRAHQQLEILKNNLIRRNESFVQALGEIVYDYDVPEDHIGWSGAYSRLLGYSLEEMGTTRDDWLAKVHPDDYEAVVKAFEQAQTERRLFDLEYRVKSIAGNYIWMYDRGVLHFNPDGTLQQALGILVNITEQKQVELELRTRANQQAGVANLGTQALAGGLILRLMDDAATLLAGLLNAEYSQVLEYLPENQTFLLRAGIGWKEGNVGSATVDVDPHVQPGFTLRSDDPVFVEDFCKESRFTGEPLLEDHNIQSSINVTIPGPNQPFGILGVYARTPLAFNQGDGHFLQGIANVLGESIARNKIEAELVEEELTLHGIIEGSPAAIYVKDLQGRYFLSNKKHKAFWSNTQGEIEGKTDHDLFSPDVAAAIQADDRKVLLAGIPMELEEVIPHEKGTRTLISNKFLLRNNQGTPYAICGISTDITERKHIEAELKTNEQGIRELYEITAAQNSTFEQRIQQLLEMGCRRFRLSQGLLTRLDGDLLKVAMAYPPNSSFEVGSHVPICDIACKVALVSDRPICLEHLEASEWQERLDCKTWGMEAYMGVQLIVNQHTFGTICFTSPDPYPGMFTDADQEFLKLMAKWVESELERREAEDRILHLNTTLEERVTQRTAELEIKNAELERFSYAVSHDLKSPLVTIQGFLKMLGDDAHAGRTTRLDEDIQRIAGAAQKMQQLLNEVLELSRIGRIVSSPEPVAIGDVIHDAVKQVSGQIAAGRVHVNIEPELPVVWGDRPRLVDVIQNLVSNAIKFMGAQPEPRIDIGMRQEGKEAVIFVRDNGIGIEPQYQENIFGLFERLDAQTEGTGVGLALVKRIIEVQGGRIWVKSEGQGRGSTFCFTLPLKIESPPTATTLQNTEPA